MPIGIPKGARCVQRFDDSLNSAIHITYRISLRSSSMREPRDPLLKVVMCLGGSESALHSLQLGFGMRLQGSRPSVVEVHGGFVRLSGDGRPLHGPWGPEQGDRAPSEIR